MPLPAAIPVLAAVGFGGAFIGSQIDDKVEQQSGPIGGGINQSLPVAVKIPLMIALGTAAFFATKKFIKKGKL